MCFEAGKTYFWLEAKASLKMTSIIPPKKNKSNNPINQPDRYEDTRNTSPGRKCTGKQPDTMRWSVYFKFCLEVITWCTGGKNELITTGCFKHKKANRDCQKQRLVRGFFSGDNDTRKQRGRAEWRRGWKYKGKGEKKSKRAASDLRQDLRTFTLNSRSGYCHSPWAVSGSTWSYPFPFFLLYRSPDMLINQ